MKRVVQKKNSMRLPSIGTTNPRFPSPPLVDNGLISLFEKANLDVGVCSQQGMRNYQEDRFVVFPYLQSNEGKSSENTHLFGIFDGHAGSLCSSFVSSVLPDVLRQDVSFDNNLLQSLPRSFHSVNDQFLKTAEKQRLHDGSTGICCVMRGKKMVVANVGDCRLVVVSGGRTSFCTRDQKPTNPEEQRRILALGGTLVNCSMGVIRVNGVLAVSRAFGNYTLRSVIKPDAEVIQRELCADDHFIVIASDGLWDVLKNKDVTDICYNMIAEEAQTIADELVRLALAKGSMDNITCIIVKVSNYISRLNSTEKNIENNFTGVNKYSPLTISKSVQNHYSPSEMSLNQHRHSPTSMLKLEHISTTTDRSKKTPSLFSSSKSLKPMEKYDDQEISAINIPVSYTENCQLPIFDNTPPLSASPIQSIHKLRPSTTVAILHRGDSGFVENSAKLKADLFRTSNNISPLSIPDDTKKRQYNTKYKSSNLISYNK